MTEIIDYTDSELITLMAEREAADPGPFSPTFTMVMPSGLVLNGAELGVLVALERMDHRGICACGETSGVIGGVCHGCAVRDEATFKRLGDE